MRNITVEAALVGMRYYGVSANDARKALLEGSSLSREPQNPHDSNAVAVIHRDRKLGHVSRDSAQVIAPLLDKGARSSLRLNRSKTGSKKSIPITISVSLSVEVVSSPFVCDARTCGIYRIRIRGEDKSYFGQSLDIQSRIRQHWNDLSYGMHSNPELQELWDFFGSKNFEAKVVELAPEGLADLALARWLVQRERHWIGSNGGMRSVINADYPSPVLSTEVMRHLEALRDEASDELNGLRTELERLRKRRVQIQALLAFSLSVIRKSERWWGIFLSAYEREQAEKARANVKLALLQREQLEKKVTEAKKNLQDLEEYLLLDDPME